MEARMNRFTLTRIEFFSSRFSNTDPKEHVQFSNTFALYIQAFFPSVEQKFHSEMIHVKGQGRATLWK